MIDAPVSDWEAALIHLPFLRGAPAPLRLPIGQDMARIYAAGDPRVMWAAVGYLRVRFDFWVSVLNQHKTTQDYLEAAAETQYWWLRMEDRLREITPGRVGAKGRWIKPKAPRRTKHIWLN